MKRRLVVIAVVLVVIAGGGYTAAAVYDSRADEQQPAQDLPAATAQVEQGDLVDTETVDGSLGYGNERTLTGGASGTVTWVRGEGATVTRGKRMYEVDGDKVFLMYGGVPMYRTLSQGSEGKDVEQLERNLKKLGYGDGMTVDDEFTTATEDAVLAWQDDMGLPETGTIDASQAIVASGPVRITEAKVSLGGQAKSGAPVYTITSTKRVVHIDLDVADQDLAHKGAKVGIELPDGDTVKGSISKVGTVAKTASSGGGGSSETTIEVTVTLDKPKQADGYDEAPVSVDLESQRAENVLSVPVEALLALPGGGYAVQVVDGETATTEPVEVGVYAKGHVEVSGSGVKAGLTVGVPAE